MNVLFIFSVKDSLNPFKPLKEQESIPMGVAHISAFLKSRNHKTEVIVLTKRTKKKYIDEIIKIFKPGLICFSAVASEYDFISEIAGYIKSRYPSVYLLIGGVHASLNPHKVIFDPFDALCIGEGEHPTLELAEQLEMGHKPGNIRNLWFKHASGIEKNDTRDFISDLDTLPFPDRDIWQGWISNVDSKQSILLGRGCFFDCFYCCNHILRNLAEGEYVRFRSTENILNELKEIVSKFPRVEKIFLETETITSDMKFALDLCLKLEEYNRTRQVPLSFKINVRIIPNFDYATLFRALKRANIHELFIGVESGSKRVREEILKKHYSNEDILKTIEMAKSYGFTVSTFIMIGIPGETLSDYKETIRCIRECQPSNIIPYIVFPYEGTELYKVTQEKGLLKNKLNPTRERCVAVLDLPGFSKKQIQKEFDWVRYNIYKGFKPLYVLLIGVFRRRIGSKRIFYNLYSMFRYLQYYIQHKCIQHK